MKYWFSVISILFVAVNYLYGQPNHHQEKTIYYKEVPELITIPRINGIVTLDGLSRESAWNNIPSYKMITLLPHRDLNPAEPTEVLFAYDDEYLYLAARMYDSVPEKIQISSYERDSGSPSMDWIAFMIDSFNDDESGLAFATTPSALRWDAAIANDYISSRDRNNDWNGYWEAEAVITDNGWFSEMRIPFSSLNFKSVGEEVKMGITSWRIHPRTNETQVFPAISQNWGFRGVMKPSQAQSISFENLRSSRAIYFTPYILNGFGQYKALNDSENFYKNNEEYPFEIGADLKYGLTSKLTLDLTVNTDFAQVEADDYQINLTRYSLFFPEKRRFFQERAGTFDFTFESSDNNRLFHSRRIGIKNGKPIRIYGGMRLSGKIGNWDTGFLTMQTSSVDNLPSENFGVLRMKRQFINSGSYIGGIITSRLGNDGSYNLAYGVDTKIQYYDNDFFSLRFAQTAENGTNFEPFSSAPSRLMFKFYNINTVGYKYGLSVNYSGRDYNPGIGFQRRSNYSRLHLASGYGWRPSEKNLLAYHSIFVHGQVHISNVSREMESSNLGASWYLENKAGYNLYLTADHYQERLNEAFNLTNSIIVPKDDYEFLDFGISFYTPNKNLYSGGIGFNTGSFYDGWKNSIELEGSFKISASLNFSLIYDYNSVQFNDRNSDFNSHLGRIKILYMMNKEFSINSFLQFSSINNLVSSNVNIRYNPSEGIDLYLVYNENLNTDRYRMSPVLPVSMGRTILLKYNYTMRM